MWIQGTSLETEEKQTYVVKNISTGQIKKFYTTFEDIYYKLMFNKDLMLVKQYRRITSYDKINQR